MKKFFPLAFSLAIGASLLVFSSCEKAKEYAPKILLEYPIEGKEFFIGDSIRLKYSIEDVSGLASVKVRAEVNIQPKHLPGQVKPSPAFEKTTSGSTKVIAVDEKFKINTLYGLTKAPYFLYVEATDAKGNTFTFRRTINITSL